MKRLKNLLFAAIAAITFASCSSVPVGHVGVKVYMLGTSKGVSTEKLGVGRYWIGWNEKLYNFPTYTQNYVYTAAKSEGKPNDESISFQTVEAMTIHANVGVAYHIEQDDAVKVFQKYQEGVNEITAGPLRNEVRNVMNDIASKYTVENILGKGKVSFMDSVKRTIIRDMKKVGVSVEDVYLVGKLAPPENIEAAINAKIQATQDAITAQNEIQKTIANAKRDSIEATGKQKANHQLEQSLSPQLLRKMWIDKWDGKLPTVISGSNTTLMLPTDGK